MVRITALFALLSVAAAHASPPSDELVETYIEVAGLRDNWEQIKASLPQVMKGATQPLIDGSLQQIAEHCGPTAPVEELRTTMTNGIDKVIAQSLADFDKTVTWERIVREVYLPTIKRIHEQDELEGLIAFLRTDAGMRFRAKQTQVISATTEQMQALIEPVQTALAQKLPEVTNSLQTEILPILQRIKDANICH